MAGAGLAGSTVRSGPIFDFALRPMQAACQDVTLPDGPMLAVIEDETGAGKTEAALITAHRMAQAGKGRGSISPCRPWPLPMPCSPAPGMPSAPSSPRRR